METVLAIVRTTRNGSLDRLEGIYAFAHRQSWNVQVVEHLAGVERLREAVRFFRPIGAIVDCGGRDLFKLPEEFDTLPVVFNDLRPQHADGRFCVTTDSASVGALAARHLLGLNLANYAFVGFSEPLEWSEARGRAFAKTVETDGRSCSAFVSTARQSPFARRRKLTDWLRVLPRPCGLFAANDAVSEEVEMIAHDLGIGIPDELAILGVDDNPMICENQRPTLSSVVLDFTHGAYQAAELLGRMLARPSMKPQTVVLRVERVTVRESTRRIPCDPSRVAKALEFIRMKATEGLAVKDVVEIMQTSRRTAEMHFRETTGRSILEEIESVRMEKVEALLRKPNQALGPIAALCGYATNGALRKAFRLRTHMSMREWRERHLFSKGLHAKAERKKR